MSSTIVKIKNPHSALRNVVNKVSIITAGLAIVTTNTLSDKGASAATLTIPSITVNGTDVFSGSSFTVNEDFLGTDTISLVVSGTVNTATGDLPEGYTVNAAGIATKPGRIFGAPISTGNFTAPFTSASRTYNYGALLLGNSTLGFRQLFAPTTANGLSSSAPLTTLSLNNATLASIFGSGLTNGSVLQFRIADVNNGDNNGAFTVSGSINSATTAVPEPFTIIGTLIGGTAAFRMRKKIKDT